MLIKSTPDIQPSEITGRGVYLQRRAFIRAAGLAALSASAAGALYTNRSAHAAEKVFGSVSKSPFSTTEEPTSYKDATNYNNYYEFGTDKDSPARYASTLK